MCIMARRRRGHRAIGVVYRPEYEHFGNYVPTGLPRRYDALLSLDLT
jgi:erythromycin esterase-like protein